MPERERSPATAEELSEKNWRAWGFHQECAAVGKFPDDDIVRRNAALIKRIEDMAAEVRRTRAAVAAFPFHLAPSG